VLLCALPRLLDAQPAVTLTVVGGGAEEHRNKALARDLGVDHATTFLGSVPHARVAAELWRADVLVVPSRTQPNGAAEGHPVAPKEAYATGTLVLATDCGGLPEVVPPEERPNLVPEGDADALAGALVELLGRPAEWAERARAGRGWVEREFDARSLAMQVAALYERMLGT
jgi:glycogen synthase